MSKQMSALEINLWLTATAAGRKPRDFVHLVNGSKHMGNRRRRWNGTIITLNELLGSKLGRKFYQRRNYAVNKQ